MHARDQIGPSTCGESYLAPSLETLITRDSRSRSDERCKAQLISLCFRDRGMSGTAHMRKGRCPSMNERLSENNLEVMCNHMQSLSADIWAQ